MEKEIGQEIRRVHHGIDKHFRADAHLSVPRMPFFVLGFLAESEEPVYLKDIENKFKVNRSTAIEFVDKLESEGFIERTQDAGDGRRKRLKLTEKAVRHHEFMKSKKAETERIMKENISEEELAVFFGVIDKICINLEKV